mgnify:CR=1 FL=1
MVLSTTTAAAQNGEAVARDQGGIIFYGDANGNPGIVNPDLQNPAVADTVKKLFTKKCYENEQILSATISFLAHFFTDPNQVAEVEEETVHDAAALKAAATALSSGTKTIIDHLSVLRNAIIARLIVLKVSSKTDLQNLSVDDRASLWAAVPASSLNGKNIEINIIII